MTTAYITHPACLLHDTGVGHPESIARLRAIEERLALRGLNERLMRLEAPEAKREQLAMVHDEAHLHYVESHIPASDWMMLDSDTWVCPHSLKAAYRAAGAVIHGVDLVMTGRVDNAFCAIRPPGHHAERHLPMGFCLFNNIAVGAAHAFASHGLERVAIVDFDVHHGNGTEDIFRDEPRLLFCSSFQYPHYPNRPFANSDHVVCSPLAAGSGSDEFREAVRRDWLPALDRFRPQIVLVSAGFDGHQDDTLADLNLQTADFRWVTEQILAVADEHAAGRVVSTLEGGYDLDALSASVEAHLRALMREAA